MKKLLCYLTAAVLLLSVVPVSLAEEAAADAKTSLVSEITNTAVSYLATDDVDLYMYRNMDWTSIADTLPAKFDLRDRGVVPSVRSQGEWGTCWGFASIAASEISLLSSLGITAQEYKEATGSEFDLSEKHLAWFGTSHLPTLDQYPEGEYPYPESQAGEGEWHDIEDTKPSTSHYFAGGFMGYAASVFANGVGPTLEALYPYTANDGSASTKADWSIDESARFQMVAELVNSSILPSPSQRDENGQYYYNAVGTEAIKKELLAGRGVSIAYHSQQVMSKEAEIQNNIEQYVEKGLDSEAAEIYVRVNTGNRDIYDLNAEERVLFMKGVLVELGQDPANCTAEELEKLAAEKFDTYAQALSAQLKAKENGTENTSDAADAGSLEEAAAELAALGMSDEAAYIAACVFTGIVDPYDTTREERMSIVLAYALLQGETIDSVPQEMLEQIVDTEYDALAEKIKSAAAAQAQSAGKAESRTAEEIYAEYVAKMVANGMSEADAEKTVRLFMGYDNIFNTTREERVNLVIAYAVLIEGAPANQLPESVIDNFVDNNFMMIVMQIQEKTSDLPPSAEQVEKMRAAAEKLGRDYDTYSAYLEKVRVAKAGSYMNGETAAQYVSNQYAPTSHAVTIIGWDDDYPVENFLASDPPPAPGAWLVRNSWDEGYGIGGYFWLSYYDQTIMAPETFEYVLNRDSLSGVHVSSYDNMQASAVSSVQTEDVVYSANIFPVEEDAVLTYVSVMTADLNAKSTVAVYLLNENYTSPVDGTLLDVVTADFEFGGYHRIELNHAYQLTAGSVISVVQKQATITANGLRYTLPFTNSSSKEAAYLSEDINPQGMPAINWFVGCIGENESFVCVGDTWYDWKDIVNEVQANNNIAAMVEFDNMNIKAYFYTVDGVNAAHKYGPAQQYMGAEALICEECGDTLIVVK